MSYAILRIEKIKSFGSIGKHIDRGYEGHVHVPENVDPGRIELNLHWNEKGKFFNQKEWMEYTRNNSLSRRVNERIKAGYKLEKTIRKDAVRGLEYLFTSEHHKMTSIVSDSGLFKEWMQTNKEFLKQLHGEENIISMSCHFDELTPHVHAVVVPITKDGRLSARDFINGKNQLSGLQTKYAQMMSKFGMNRGKEGSTRHHEKSNRDHLNRHFER